MTSIQPPKGVIYVSGHMRGPGFNFAAFDEAKAKLESEGWTVISPADLAREAGCAADGSVPASLNADIFKREIMAIFDIDAMYVLPGWEANLGTIAEVTLARALKKQIIFAGTPA